MLLLLFRVLRRLIITAYIFVRGVPLQLMLRWLIMAGGLG